MPKGKCYFSRDLDADHNRLQSEFDDRKVKRLNVLNKLLTKIK